MRVEREPAYQAVAANLGGSTPRELYEDVLEVLEGTFAEHCVTVRDAIKALGLEGALVGMADGGELRAALLAGGQQQHELEALPALPLYERFFVGA